jgi:hypothetical protein
LLQIMRWVLITAFGWPVEPEVNSSFGPGGYVGDRQVACKQ